MKQLKETIRRFRRVTLEEIDEMALVADRLEVDFLAGRLSAFGEVLVQIKRIEKSAVTKLPQHKPTIPKALLEEDSCDKDE